MNDINEFDPELIHEFDPELKPRHKINPESKPTEEGKFTIVCSSYETASQIGYCEAIKRGEMSICSDCKFNRIL